MNVCRTENLSRIRDIFILVRQFPLQHSHVTESELSQGDSHVPNYKVMTCMDC